MLKAYNPIKSKTFDKILFPESNRRLQWRKPIYNRKRGVCFVYYREYNDSADRDSDEKGDLFMVAALL